MTFIVPEAVLHDKLDQEVGQIFQTYGYHVISDAYHLTLPPEESVILRQVYSPAALLYRTKADNIAVNRSTGDSLYVECKAPLATKNLFLEALPLYAHWREQVSFGADCLYVYRGPLSNNRIVARHVQHIIKSVRSLTISPRECNQSIGKSLAYMAEKHLPDIQIIYRSVTRGSGDPFFTIPGDWVQTWSRLEDVIESRKEV